MRKSITSAALAMAFLAGTTAMALAQGEHVGNRGAQDNVGNTSGPALDSSAAGGIYTEHEPLYGTYAPYGTYGTSAAPYGGYGASAPPYGAYGSTVPPYAGYGGSAPAYNPRAYNPYGTAPAYGGYSSMPSYGTPYAPR